MKKLLILISILLIPILSMAQEKVGKYHSSYFNMDYDVSADYEDNNLTVYITATGEYNNDEVLIGLEGNTIYDFISALKTTKTKFQEWKEVARDNGVTDMRKDFNITFPRVTIAWRSSEWWFDFRHTLHPTFWVTKEGLAVFVLTGKAKSSTNEYITQKYYFALSATSDFDSLLNAINPDTVKSKLGKKQDVQDLFK